jgi:uncharacterized membrane protein
MCNYMFQVLLYYVYVMVFLIIEYAEFESDDNANVHGIMKRDITKTVIIIVSSILAGIILLLLLAIITLLPLTVLNCRKYRSRRFNRQQ